MTLLDLLNTPDAIDGLADLTPDDRAFLSRQIQSYRYALRVRVPVGVSRQRLAGLKTRDRQAAARGLATVRRLSDVPADPDRKLRAMERAMASQPDYAPLARWVILAPERGRRLLRKVAHRRTDVATATRELARLTWSQLESAEATDRQLRGAVLGTTLRMPPPSASAQRLSQAWERAWAKLPIKRVRRCQWDGCDVPSGRLFIAATSERDCPTCRTRYSRDTRSRVRRGVTERPRVRR